MALFITGSRTRTSSRTSGGIDKPIDAILAALETSRAGLTDDEAARRRARHGLNVLPPPRRISSLHIFLDQFRGVVVLLLVGATVVSLLLGDVIEATAIATVLAINTAIGFTTEWRAHRAMASILQLDVVRAAVVRGGSLRMLDARDLVPGDIIEVTAGHQVPADARVIDATDLRVSEAALTGESLPVSKDGALVLPEDTPLADRRNMVYRGTTVAAGVGHAAVTATGAATEIGRIGELTDSVAFEPTPLERRLDALGQVLVWAALAIAALVAGLDALHGAPLDLIVQTGIALAVAAAPEALPAVATIALAVGMRRMAARKALVRRLPVVESLGSTTVVCADKTRTLTSGHMAVVRVWTPGHEEPVDPHTPPHGSAAVRRVLEAGVLASRPPAAAGEHRGVARIDPVDNAIVNSAARLGIDRAAMLRERPELALVPFSSERKFMAAFQQMNGSIVATVKGAPARVMDLCRFTTSELSRSNLERINNVLAREGLRVLAVASGTVRAPNEAALIDLAFVGFIGLADPPAPEVKNTIARLRGAGLRTVMITGDQRLTAEAVGRELNLVPPTARAIDGREMDALSADQLREAVATTSVFSRISPEQKLRIVRALQERGEIVAMLGDGINDAPALRQADVGVAMGTRGTDVAKSAAAIVLSDDRFETIAAAVEEGRVVFDNIRKVVLYLFSCNVAEVLVLLAAGLAGLPLPLLPLQLLWLNMITDTFPALALAVEPPEPDLMRRPPRRPEEAILSRPFVLEIFWYGALITASTLASFVWALAVAPDRAKTMAFMTLALAQIAHLGNARRHAHVVDVRHAITNRYALGAVALSGALQVLTISVEPLRELLRLSPLGVSDWGVVLACAAAPALVGQAAKLRRPAPGWAT